MSFAATPRDDEAKGAWWEMYGDPVLSALMHEVSLANQELAQAEARYRQSRALVARYVEEGGVREER